jgi:hypothetical protein
MQKQLIRHGRAGFFKDNDYDKLRKAMDKQFSKREALSKAPGWDKLSDPGRASQTLGELASGYEAIRDATRFRQVASDTLTQAPGSLAPQQTLTSAQLLFLELVAMYGKIVWMVQNLGADLRVLVAGYNSAHFLVHRRDDDAFVEVCAFVARFQSDALREAAADLDEHGEAVRELVSSLIERHLSTWLHQSVDAVSRWPDEWQGGAMALNRERARSWWVARPPHPPRARPHPPGSFGACWCVRARWRAAQRW